MANSKIKTLWTLSGRVVDSREVLDSNGGMFSGRIDIPESLMVKFEGYTKIEYRMTTSDGYVVRYPTFEALMLSVKSVDETKTGSGFMTMFVPRNVGDAHGIFQIDVYKEWEDETVDPEPEPPAIDPFVMLSRASAPNAFGFNMHVASGSRRSLYFTGNDINASLPSAAVIKDLEARLKALEAKVTTPAKS